MTPSSVGTPKLKSVSLEIPAKSRFVARHPPLASFLPCKQFTVKSISNKHILVADDDESMLHALERVLTSEGAVVTATKWAGDAIEALLRHEKKIDLIITDLRMPLVTGLTLVSSVHRIHPSLPIIVLTAFGSPVIKTECLNQGAAAFLEKPLDTSELLDAIDSVFEAARSQAAASTAPKE